MLEFMVKKDFAAGKNMKAFLRVTSVYYNIFKDEWLFELVYFLDKKTAQFYRVSEFLYRWIEEHPYLINEKSWVWLQQTYFSRDWSKLPLLTERVKLVSTDYLYFGTEGMMPADNVPIIVGEFWYNKTREQIAEWVKTFILANKKLFKINEMFESSGSEEEFKNEILAPIIEKIKEME